MKIQIKIYKVQILFYICPCSLIVLLYDKRWQHYNKTDGYKKNLFSICCFYVFAQFIYFPFSIQFQIKCKIYEIKYELFKHRRAQYRRSVGVQTVFDF